MSHFNSANNEKSKYIHRQVKFSCLNAQSSSNNHIMNNMEQSEDMYSNLEIYWRRSLGFFWFIIIPFFLSQEDGIQTRRVVMKSFWTIMIFLEIEAIQAQYGSSNISKTTQYSLSIDGFMLNLRCIISKKEAELGLEAWMKKIKTTFHRIGAERWSIIVSHVYIVRCLQALTILICIIFQNLFFAARYTDCYVNGYCSYFERQGLLFIIGRAWEQDLF